MRIGRFFLYLFATLLFVVTGCFDDKDDVIQNELAPKLNDSEKINKFIVDCTQELYLWESQTDWKEYSNYDTYRKYSDHYELFGKLIYEEDRWSELTNDIDSWQSSLQGISTTYGYTLIFGKFLNKDAYYAIILFVYPGTPAETAGLKRGDIIVGMNGGDITSSNYTGLYYSSSISLRLGVLDT
ncbi:MAG: PDZ domain-containing protein, partial [Tannerella sp.]|nr:PDZ domain-containing protein [Tannerella sp.]